ncbi:glycoside hydrolase family 43 protein [Rhodocytophaga aerolata]|uniref:Glycoside hydrolase family 43 protein n=1 Tax=Rhodocytophaga aerolata TaxID=455078 RepID=A0ABT8RCM5_9BACT|nr:glycoside hydrolase family 43 protein [Rhodocytophaga aerolata]MDO1449456.1 glycoside hydrolase family 43 protein [Rhodocytophaga aerolata]
MKKRLLSGNVLWLVLLIVAACSSKTSTVTEAEVEADLENTFTNPLLPGGPDPWAFYHEGYYYYTHTLIDSIGLWRTKDITDLKNAEYKTIWIPTDPKNAKDLWAPEIHYIKGKWYIYYAADDGNTDNHQLYVLENASKNPFEGAFTMKARIQTDPGNNWAIDGSVFEHQGDYYMVWSGWQTRRVSTETQCIYIAKMANPWTLGSERVLISKPEFEWERNWQNPDGWTPNYTIYVNEGPQPLKNTTGDKVFVIYSASGCWTPQYALGMLTASATSNLLDAKSWTKSRQPVFKQAPENKVFGTGHNSFFKSPDGTEDWILYHANDKAENPCGPTRSPRAQKITWQADGMPDFGTPLSTDTPIQKPSGIK